MPDPYLEDALSFVHLSDIHFKKKISNTFHDIDRDIRNQMLSDLRKQEMAPCGILVSGDIAFSGKQEEYAVAHDWLQSLLKVKDLNQTSIWTVPGNHDIDRDVVNNSKTLQKFRNEMRTCELNDLDNLLREYCVDPLFADNLLSPLRSYNEFATFYGCDTSANCLRWTDNLRLNDGSTLALTGINSALISDSNDNDAQNKLVVGTVQAVHTDEDGVVYLTMCHHPSDWIRDSEEVTDYLNSRVKVQLFGHKHTFRHFESRQSLCVAAGATHPDRREPNWSPRYNLIQLRVDGSDRERSLTVRVYPRVWDKIEKKFISSYHNDKNHIEATFNLPPWLAPTDSTGASSADTPTTVPNGPTQTESPVHAPLETQETLRELTFNYYSLPYETRMKIVSTLDLARKEDEAVVEFRRFPLYFERASSEGRLPELTNEIERRLAESRAE